jgi:hypothetical protein
MSSSPEADGVTDALLDELLAGEDRPRTRASHVPAVYGSAQRMPVSQLTLTVVTEPAATVARRGWTWQPRPGPGAVATAVTT